MNPPTSRSESARLAGSRLEVLSRANALLSELERVDRSQGLMPSYAAAMIAAGFTVLMLAIAIITHTEFLRGAEDVKASWVPFYGASILALVAAYFWRRSTPSLAEWLTVTLLLSLSFLTAMSFNGYLTVYGLAFAVTFIHVTAPPNVALGTSLVFIGASVFVLYGSPNVSPAAALRLIAASVVALLVVQMLSRQNRKLSQAAHGVTEGLRGLVHGLEADLHEVRGQLDVAARKDPQTGLLNARAFEDHLNGDQMGLKAHSQALLVAVRFERLDEFLTALDAREKHLFFNLLVQRLEDGLGAGVKGRLSKWEFAALVPLKGLVDGVLKDRLADQWASLSKPAVIGRRSVPLKAVVGVVVWPEDAQSAPELLSRAEIALLMADSLRITAPVWFDRPMEAIVEERSHMIEAIDRALQRNEFELFYQPIVGFQGEPVCKVEALIRWNDPVRGQVSPAEFIPLAESYGKIVPLTAWVLEQAVSQVILWRQTLDPAFQISINMPPAYLESCAAYPAEALQALSALQVPPGSIVLEITEGVFLNVTPEIQQVLALLKGMGFGVALDDFGVGYSSFGQLYRLSLDTLKIDKSLVDHIESAPAKRAVCAAIIKVGQELGCKVVAEGVETAGQQALLAQAGCDFVQGFLIARPMSAADFEAFAKR